MFCPKCGKPKEQCKCATMSEDKGPIVAITTVIVIVVFVLLLVYFLMI